MPTKRTSTYSNDADEVLVAAAKLAGKRPVKYQHDVTLAQAHDDLGHAPPPPPPPSPPPVTDPEPPDVVADKVDALVWRDEFETLDRSKWNVLDGVRGWDENAEETYRSSQVTAAFSVLRLTAQRNAAGNGYDSGGVTTKAESGTQRFAFTHGYVAARIKMPVGGGYWPALWLRGDTKAPGWPAYGEFDIMEAYGTDPEAVECTTHWREQGQNQQKGGQAIPLAGGPQSDWHEYGLLWEPKLLSYLIDGKIVQTFKADTPDKLAALGYGHTITLNLAVGGNGPRKYHGWKGTWKDGELPGIMEVDWVRVYALK